MSALGSGRGLLARLVQAAALACCFGAMLLAARNLSGGQDLVLVIGAVGLLLLAGTLLSELLEPFGLPHLSGYLLAGVISGPHVLHLVSHSTVEHLSPINTLALALIALAGGAELRADVLVKSLRSLLAATVTQVVFVLLACAGTFMAAARFMPFAADFGTPALIGVALLWGVLAVSRSPSACLGILAQTRAKGPLTTFSVAFIMSSDVVVVLLLALAMMVARPLIMGGGSIALGDLQLLGHEILGSVAIGTTLGLALAIYLRLIGRQLLLVLLVLGFVVTEGLRYIHFDPLLTFLSAGFVVQNLSHQGPKLLHAVERTGSVVYVVFFATAGAHLDLALLTKLWPVALSLALSRAVATWIAARAGAHWAKDPPVLKRYGWAGLVSQAGLTLGLSVVIERAFPTLAGGFRSLVIATVAINELIGPVLFKLSLDRAGESARTAPEERTSLSSVH